MTFQSTLSKFAQQLSSCTTMQCLCIQRPLNDKQEQECFFICRQLLIRFSPLLYLYGHAGSGVANRHQQACSSSSPLPEAKFQTVPSLFFSPQVPRLILPPWHTPTRLRGWVSHQPPAEPQEKHRRSRTVATSSVQRLE